MPSHNSFELPGPRGGIIRGDIHPPVAPSPAPAVILCHGFKGFKDWGFFPYLADHLADAGYLTIRFNFSHNGIGPDLQNFTELGRFKANTLTTEAADLDTVINALHNRDLPLTDHWNGAYALAGHSRGGYAVTTAAAERQQEKRPQPNAIILLASLAEVPPVTPEEEAAWRKAGAHFIRNTRTNQDLPLGLELLEDLKRNHNRIQQNIASLQTPILAIHGTNDMSVPVDHAHLVAKWGKAVQLQILEGADHTFGAVHPFAGPTPDLMRVLSSMIDFMS